MCSVARFLLKGCTVTFKEADNTIDYGRVEKTAMMVSEVLGSPMQVMLLIITNA